ncbi:MAG: TIGR03564 family F420-dependent LLM class oxidoreductase [Acidimicrobiales bacterium]
MDIGISDSATTVGDIIKRSGVAAEQGFSTYSMPQTFSLDVLTAIAVASTVVPGIDFATAVVPTYRQHPMMLAQQALTVSQVSGGRLILGIGLSHQVVVEGMWGLSYGKPLRHMREYLDVLMPILEGQPANAAGEVITGRGAIDAPAPRPTVVLAALGPKMLELAGRVADGTATWMVGPATLRAHTLPVMAAAAEAADRSAPRALVSLPVCVTENVDVARARAAEDFAIYGQLPSYRAMLDREGASGPEDVAIIGSADEVATRISDLFDAGATMFSALEFGDTDEKSSTRELLVSLL